MTNNSTLVADLLDSLMHQGMIEKGVLIRVGGQERKFDPARLYVESGKLDHQRTLRDPLKPLVLMRGPRGSGKSLAFSTAAQYINDGRRSSTSAALQLSCWNIGMRVRQFNEAGAQGRAAIKLATLVSTILEITTALQKVRLRRARGKSLIDKLFQRDDQFLGRVRALADSAEKFLKGQQVEILTEDETRRAGDGTARSGAISSDQDVARIFSKLKESQLAVAADFLDLISNQGIDNLFLFFDDYSEIDRDARVEMIAALEAFFNAPNYQKKSIRFPVRVAVYWGDEFRTRLVGNVVQEELGTDPFSAHFSQQEQPGLVVDQKFGEHVYAIILARCEFFGIDIRRDLFAGSSESECIDVCSFLARISGGNLRIVAKYLKHLHARDVPLRLGEIRSRCDRFFDAERDEMVRSALQYYSDDPAVVEQHLEMCDWLREEAVRCLQGARSAVIKTRFLPLDHRCALKVKAFVNAGVAYPINSVYLRNAVGGPTMLFALNEGLRIAWVGDAITEISDVPDSEFMWAFKRIDERLRTWKAVIG